MNGTVASAKVLAGGIAAKVRAEAGPLPEIAICPPAPLINVVAAALENSPVAYGGQDCHPAEKGAHTGDVSPVLLAECGCRYVIVGHSERRSDHGETEALVQAKAAAARAAGLVPIICVGETAQERDRGDTAQVIARQVAGSLPEGSAAVATVIGYEPVWAIGTERTPTIAEIEAVHTQIRELFAKAHGDATKLRILYGGSVKGSNAAQVLAADGVNGVLVGGASLDQGDFWRIIKACPASA